MAPVVVGAAAVRIDARKGRLPNTGARLTGVDNIAAPNVVQGLVAAASPILEQLERGDRLQLARLQQDAAIDFNAEFDVLERDYDGSEAGFAQTVTDRLTERARTFVEAQPPRRRQTAQARLSGLVSQQILAAQRVEAARRDQFIARGIREWGQTAVNQIATQPELYDSFQDSMDDVIADAPAGLQGALRDELGNDLATAYGTARINDDPAALIADLNSGALDQRLNGRTKQTLLDAATREIERRQRESELAERRRQAELKQRVKAEIDDIDQILETFGTVPENRLAGLQALAGQAGDPALAAEITQKVLAATEVASIAVLPPGEGQARVNALKADETIRASAHGARLVEAAQKAVNAKRARLDRDPVGTAIDEGLIEPLQPDALSLDVLNRRAAQSRAYAQENGIAPQILSESERNDFANYLAKDPNGFTVAVGIAGTRGGDALLSEVFPKQPTLVHLAGLAASGADRAFIDDVRAGIEARSEKGFRSLVPRVQGRDTARAVIGAATVLDPEFAQAVIDSANAAYEVRGPQRNVDPETLDTDLYTRLLNEAVGATFGPRGEQRGGFTTVRTDYGEQAVIAPGWMRADKFNNVFRTLSDDHIDRASGGRGAFTINGEPITNSQLRRMVPVPAGNGRYRLRYGPEAYVFDQYGIDYELDLNRLRGDLGGKVE